MKITDDHLARGAFICIRQSTVDQLADNHESWRRQYGLAERDELDRIADADTALVEEVAVGPANINDGRAGPDALPDNPGEVFADSAYRGAISAMRCAPKAAHHASLQPPCGGATRSKPWHGSTPGTNRYIASAGGSRRSLVPGSGAMVFAKNDAARHLSAPFSRRQFSGTSTGDKGGQIAPPLSALLLDGSGGSFD